MGSLLIALATGSGAPSSLCHLLTNVQIILDVYCARPARAHVRLRKSIGARTAALALRLFVPTHSHTSSLLPAAAAIAVVVADVLPPRQPRGD